MASTTRGTLVLGKRGTRYEGRVCAATGERHGLGTLYVDEGGGVGSSALRVRWDQGAPHGSGSFTEPDGGCVRGEWRDGVLS